MRQTWMLMASLGLLLACGNALMAGEPEMGVPQRRDYADPSGRFVFSYPEAFGTASKGTNDGFENRAAAIRFSAFSAGGIGGEAVLLQGSPTLDILAAGGLYDAIGREALPEALRRTVAGLLPVLGPGNICQQLAAETHIDPNAPAFANLTANQRQALASLDRMGNHAPVIQRCAVQGNNAVFEKEASLEAGGPRRSVYGAVRFLTGAYSAFQIVRAGARPSREVLADMDQVVTSWRVQRGDGGGQILFLARTSTNRDLRKKRNLTPTKICE